MMLYVLLTRDPASLVSAASSVARAWEEYGVDRLTVVHTPGVGQGELEALVGWSMRLFPGDVVGRVSVDSTPEALVGRDEDVLVSRLAGIFKGSCSEGGVLVVSSGSRRLVSSAVLAAAGLECGMSVAHVHFYFGPWAGLPYPYTPLRLQPLIVTHGDPPGGATGRNAAARMHEATGEEAAKLVLGKVPPLRAAVAELARRVNSLVTPRFHLPSREPPECGKLLVETSLVNMPGAGLCDERGLENLASKLAAYLQALEEHGGRELRSLLAWTGLAHLETGEGEPLPGLMLREKVVVDSNLVYYGAHRYFWEGADIYIPECLLREIHMNMAESLKGKHLRNPKAIVDILAYLALKDMIEAGAPIIPTTPGPCDTSIPKIDPLILEGKVLATGDSGAIRYWKGHPSRRIVKAIVKVHFDPDKALRQRVNPRSDPASLPRLLYSIYQVIVASELMYRLRLIDEENKLKLRVISRGEEKEVKVPYRSLLRAIGY